MTSLEPIYLAMQEAGFPFDGVIEYLPGKYQRFADPEKVGRNMNLFVYIDPTSRWARFGNKASVERPGFVRLTHQPLTDADRQKLQRLERERQIGVHRGMQKAALIWGRSVSPDPCHPYAERKGILPIYCRQWGRNLITPVYDIQFNLISAQLIPEEEGEIKTFLQGTHPANGFMLIGDRLTKTIRLVEGWATGVSVHLATDDLTVVCYSAHNISGVCQLIRNRYPASQLIICCDNDEAGLSSALKAAQRTGGVVIIVPTDPGDFRGAKVNDFNDVHNIFGLSAVEGQMYRHLLST